MKEEVIQLLRLKWLSGQLLALLSLWTVSALDLARGPVLVGVILAVLVVTLRPSLSTAVPRLFRRWLAPLLIVLFVGDLILSGRDIVPPMVRLLLLLLAVRAVSVRRNREDLQLVLLAMFLSVVSGVFTLSILFAVQAFLFALLTIGLLFLANILESTGEGETTDAEWGSFSWRDFVRGSRERASARLFRSVGLLVLLLAMTTGVLFMSIPRLHFDQAIPFLQMPTQGLSGFNSEVRLGDVTQIQQDDSVAMRVDVPGIEALPSDPYWRMLVLDRYRKGVFVSSLFFSNGEEGILPRAHRLSPFPNQWFEEQGTASGEWTFYLEGGVSRFLPLLGPFRELTFQGRQSLQSYPDVVVFRIQDTINSVFSYRVEDFLVDSEISASAMDQPLIKGLEPMTEKEQTDYPYSTLEVDLDQEEKDFLAELVGGILGEPAPEPLVAAQKIMAYLQSSHTYTLSPGSFEGGDPIVQWLREGRPGHCEFFAGAFTLLARTAGVPARMVVGFNGGSWNSYEDYFVVRNRNAHAWAEVLADDHWVRFDPTPGGGSGGGGLAASTAGGGFARDSDFKAWVDSLRVMWYRRVINFDDSAQEEMVEDISGVIREMAETSRDFVVNLWKDSVRWVRAAFSSSREVVIVLLALGLICLAGIQLYRRSGLRWRRWGLRKRRAHPIRRRAAVELRRLESFGGGENIPQERKAQLRERLLEIRFGRELDASSAVRVFREVRRFRRRKGDQWAGRD